MKWFREQTLVRLILAGVTLFALALGGCRSAPTRMYTLRPIPTEQGIAAYEGPPIRVGSVHLPAELDRIQITTQVNPQEFKIHELDEWAAPPSKLARQALTEDLVTRLPSGKVMLPNLLHAADERILSVEILELTSNANGAHLLASWQYSVGSKPDGPANGLVKIDSTCASGASAQWVDCLSILLAKLSDRISSNLAPR